MEGLYALKEREQLLAKINELEAQVAELQRRPGLWVRSCDRCGQSGYSQPQAPCLCETCYYDTGFAFRDAVADPPAPKPNLGPLPSTVIHRGRGSGVVKALRTLLSL